MCYLVVTTFNVSAHVDQRRACVEAAPRGLVDSGSVEGLVTYFSHVSRMLSTTVASPCQTLCELLVGDHE